MRLTHLKITNFRGLRDVDLPLSRFTCLIGENNAGKSSVLLALRLFHSGNALSSDDYFDPSEPVRVTLSLADITDADLARIGQHQDRIRSILRDGALTLVRSYSTDGRSTMLYRAHVPTDERFREENIAQLLKGQRAGPTLRAKVAEAFPEIAEQVTERMNQGDVRQLIQEYIASLPPERLQEVDQPLPTGIDRSVADLLPEPIYIPAVKDLADDTKTKEGATFGRVLRILLDQIYGKLGDAEALFNELHRQLNRIEHEDGSVSDDRLEEVKDIERTVQRYLQESFADVKVRIKIPPPDIKTVLQNAQIFADDGVDGPIETKGDGLRRAAVFSILRSYVELRRRHEEEEASDDAVTRAYLLLFEEPELYLHPKAQMVLFDALSAFAERHAVAVTTHSPAFFGPEATKTFVKLKKESDPTAPKPFTTVMPVDLTDMDERDRFQLICYENNNAAFFADVVVLVEGPSDYLVLPHIAQLLYPSWTPGRSAVRFARIGGKGSIAKYRRFFERFGTRVAVIADLDLLVRDFEQIEPSEESKTLQGQLLADVDAIVAENEGTDRVSGGQARDAQGRGEVRRLCNRMIQAIKDARSGDGSVEAAESAAKEFFGWVRKDDRLRVLRAETDPAFLRKKRELLAALRDQDVYVLERGAIEDYYPSSIPSGADKMTRAQCFRNKITTREEVLACADEQELPDGTRQNEFEVIFEFIFEDHLLGTPEGESEAIRVGPG